MGPTPMSTPPPSVPNREADSVNISVLTPMGETVECRSEDAVLALVASNDPAFWTAGSATLELRYPIGTRGENIMTINCRPGYGYYVMYAERREGVALADA